MDQSHGLFFEQWIYIFVNHPVVGRSVWDFIMYCLNLNAAYIPSNFEISFCKLLGLSTDLNSADVVPHLFPCSIAISMDVALRIMPEPLRANGSTRSFLIEKM